ncbi:MAG: cation-translocating P-type ATPase [Chloroflexi bacterium]|nr:cation-translocating P-type ATPase [Chloroflexota bacterium]MBP7592933.1 cation-translocating P-type ATPase [Chloroflexota bacterium]
MLNKQSWPLWHTESIESTLDALNSSAQGLSETEAQQRQAQFGPNELIERGGKHPLRLLWEQVSSTMVLILIAAVVASALLGKVTEAAAIGAIVVLFVILGFVQEYRAEQAMAALKKLAVPVVRVRRDGQLRELSARELVPGDIFVLEAGNAIPADGRLIENANLRVQESALTGESEAVEKETAVFAKADLPLGDRRNMLYMGTNVTYGRGTAVVTATSMDTELGKIATLIQSVDEGQTPLQKQLDGVGRMLAVAGVVVAALVLLIGVLSGEALEEMFLTAVSVAVAVVPEGLPAVVTITLALGAQRMLRRSALIRKLPAVETLGSVTVICSDKTGTLTVNRMTVTVIDVAGHFLELAGTGEQSASYLKLADTPDELFASRPSAIGLTLAAGALCNDASVNPDSETGRYTVMGDPTEGALLVAAQQAGVTRAGLEAALPRVAELPFDSDRKRMTTVHELAANVTSLPTAVRALPGTDAPYIAFTKGAVDGLLAITDRVWDGDKPVPLDETWRTRIDIANSDMAQKGMRVLGLGLQWLDTLDAPLEQNLVFIGLVGMIDPPRPEVKTAVATAKAAGMRPIMITGDHPLTARFIAHDLGISTDGRVKTGVNLDQMTPDELAQTVGEVSIYARVSPEHKLRIVEALQNQGQIVAMTGDGVNDSPALRKADIGVAMGITGTDVSKEASEMVLLDDNFATIVAAVEEGRVIFDNIRRFVKFSIAGNLGKVLVMLATPFFGIAVALEPLQLLWLNLLTDGLLGLGLGVEPAEKGIMQRPPRQPQASLFNEGLGRHIIWVGVFIGLVGLGVAYAAYNPARAADQTWQTMLFTTLAFLQVGQALASRSSRESFFKLGWRTNPTLLWLTVVVIGLQLVVVYLPGLESFFNVDPLSLPELLICVVLGSLAFWAIELEKWWVRRNGR